MFECLLDAAQYVTFKAELTALIDPEAEDSLRFYRLGNQYQNEGRAHRAHTAVAAGRGAVGVTFHCNHHFV